MAGSRIPARDFRDGALLRCVRTQGTWAGRVPGTVRRLRITSDGQRALVEDREASYEVHLGDGSVRRVPEQRPWLAGAIARVRAPWAPEESGLQCIVTELAEGPPRAGGDPAYWLAELQASGRHDRALFDAATGKDLLRFPRTSAAGFSPCGAFAVHFASRGRSAGVCELASLDVREVPLDLRGAAAGAPLVGPGALDAVLLTRAHAKGAPALRLVELARGGERWRRDVGADETPLARCEEGPEEDHLVWTADASDETLRAYRVSDGALVRTLRGAGFPRRWAFTRDGCYAVFAGWRTLARVDLRSGEVLRYGAASDHPIAALAWEPGGARYAAVTSDGVVRVYARSDGAQVGSVEAAQTAPDAAHELAFEPGSTRLVCASTDPARGVSQIERLDWRTGASSGCSELPQCIVVSIACAGDGSCAWLRAYQPDAYGSPRRSVLWSLREDRALAERPAGGVGYFPALGFRAHPKEGGALVAECADYGKGTCEWLATSSGAPLSQSALLRPDPSARVTRVEATPDRTRALWFYENAAPKRTRFDGGAGARLADPGPLRHGGADRAWFALGDEVYVLRTHVLQLRSLEDGRALERLSFESVCDRPSLVALSPDGGALLVATEGAVLVEFALEIPESQ